MCAAWVKCVGVGSMQPLLPYEKNPQTQAVISKIKLGLGGNESDPVVPFAGTLLAPFAGWQQ